MQAHPSHTSLVCETQNDGFTFVEVVIAIAILAVVITSMVALMTMNTTVALRAENKSRVTDELAQMADKLRSMPYEDAGRQSSYTSDDGLVVMRLTTQMTTLDGADAKVITIYGFSTRMDPNNKQTIQVILRSPGTGVPDTPPEPENPEDPTLTPPPTISKFEIANVLSTGALSAPVQPGQAVWGSPMVTINASAGSAASDITVMRVYADTVVVGEYAFPANNQNYSFSWNSRALEAATKQTLHADGITRMLFEVIDSRGGKTTKEINVVLDNQPPTNAFGSSAIAYTKYSNALGIDWNPILDPAITGKYAVRYKVELSVTETKGNKTTSIYNGAVITSAPPGQLPETHVEFPTTYYWKYDYEVKIYVMCTANCPHAGAGISSNYLTKYF